MTCQVRIVRGSAKSADAEQLDLEHQDGAGRDDAAGPLAAVAELRGDGQLALASHPHAGDPFVPSLDHLAGPELETEGAVVFARRGRTGARGRPAGVNDPQPRDRGWPGPGRHLACRE